jgi:hypothetical protein
MPYAIEGSGSKFIVKNKKTGDIKGHFTSRKKALRQMRLLQGVEHGWKPTGKPAKAAAGALVGKVPVPNLPIRKPVISQSSRKPRVSMPVAAEGAVVTPVTSRDLIRQGWEESYQDAQAD